MRGAWDVLHDVDNRLKTIFDALRMAKGPNELGDGTTQGMQRPTSDEDPIFCRYERRGKWKITGRDQSVGDFWISSGTPGARAPDTSEYFKGRCDQWIVALALDGHKLKSSEGYSSLDSSH